MGSGWGIGRPANCPEVMSGTEDCCSFAEECSAEERFCGCDMMARYESRLGEQSDIVRVVRVYYALATGEAGYQSAIMV